MPERVALARMAPMRSALAAAVKATARRPARPSEGSWRSGAATTSGTAASQYIAPIVGYAKTPLARRSPKVEKLDSRNARHYDVAPGKPGVDPRRAGRDERTGDERPDDALAT